MEAGSMLGSYELGRLNYEKANYAKAVEAFKVGELQQYAPSIHVLGFMYQTGVGIEKDLNKARELLERASALGHVLAKRNLASLLISGGYGPRAFFRGLGLFLAGAKDIVAITWKDPYDDRLR
jgi:TPR repeat protein